MEVDTFIRLAIRLEYLSHERAQRALALVAEVANMLSMLRFNPQYDRPEPKASGLNLLAFNLRL